jgi:hypothetical protein
MGWFYRWRYKMGVILECRLRRFGAAWVGLFVSGERRSKYHALLRQMTRLLSEQLGHEVFHTIEQNGFEAYIRTELSVIAQISCVAHHIGPYQSLYLRIQLDSRYDHFKALVQGAFIGDFVHFQQLPLLLTYEASTPRGQ